MACPYFLPTRPRAEWALARPMPLGDVYEGECHAGAETYQPDEWQLRRLCNVGYACGRCPHFPQAAAADAVHFCVADNGGDRVAIRYVEERDHHPGALGTLEYSVPKRKVLPPHPNFIVNRLAEAYAEAYLRRRS